MAIFVYGDITVDNFEYEFPTHQTHAIKELFELEDTPCIDLPRRFRHLIIARQLGGAYKLAGSLAVAMSAWGANEEDKTGLDALEPYKTYFEGAKLRREKLLRNPTDFENYLQLHYRVLPQPDQPYRVSTDVHDGFSVPKLFQKNKPFLAFLGAADPIEVLTNDREATVCLFNITGMSDFAKDPSWIADASWARAAPESAAWAIVKLSCVSVSNLQFIEELRKQLGERVIVYIAADDLRRAGFEVSKSLSWESSVQDLVDLACGKGKKSEMLNRLGPKIVVTFDYDAALFLEVKGDRQNGREVQRGVLVYSTSQCEGEFRSQYSGSMPGSRSTFIGVLTGMLHETLKEQKLENPPAEWVERLITYPLIAMRKYLQIGFHPLTSDTIFSALPKNGFDPSGKKFLDALIYNHESAFALPRRQKGTDVNLTSLPPSPSSPYHDASDQFRNPWPADASEDEYLRKDQASFKLSSITLETKRKFDISESFLTTLQRSSEPFTQYVRHGKIKGSDGLLPLPICNIGKIKTISETEINSLRAIKRLLTSYLENTAHESKPLAISVFGPPGSGKSFTVKSIFKTLSGVAESLTQDSFIECNLSGYRDPENLSATFDAARDKRLSGNIPVIFFDEFDCDLSGAKFFWLKHFLAPIQDGTFTSSSGSHPIGKSIFVFAGGICSTFSKFQAELEKSYNGGEKPSHKGRDFLSRLKGHIDVDGITPIDDNDLPVSAAPEDYFNSAAFRPYTFRRAIILRELLKEHAGTIFSGSDEARISDAVIRAFLNEPGYKHGVRSMEAIIRMSSIERRFSAECLPRKEQLLMHASDRFCTATPGSH